MALPSSMGSLSSGDKGGVLESIPTSQNSDLRIQATGSTATGEVKLQLLKVPISGRKLLGRLVALRKGMPLPF